MSTYGYGPPPPPPSAGGHGHPSPHHPPQARSGGGHNHRGRGGHYTGSGRGDYHGSQPAVHYEYSAQPYPSHPAAPYGGPHHPASSSYAPHQAQWGQDPGHGPPQHVQHQMHAPVPISSSNYHPNYAPQPYPPPQYPQTPSYGQLQQFAAPYQGQPPPSSSQWHAQTHSQQAPYGNVRQRGGYGEGVVPKPHLSGPQTHHGYGHEPPPQAVSSSYVQPYSHDPRAAHYAPQPQYPYAGPPPPPIPQRQDGYYGQSPRRGRGGGFKDNARGRGGHHGGDKHRHNKPAQNDVPKKSEPPVTGKKKKRKTNTLGLTPGMESESEDDEGEEKVLTDLIGQETLQVKDIAAFLSERKKHFPTKARVEAKKTANVARNGEDKAASLEKQADKLRKQLRKVEFSIKRKREQGDEGDDMRDSSSDESSDDEQPEAMSTRSHVAPPPPAKKADISKHCKYYSTGGTCGKMGKCRFVHDPEVREAAMKEREANNGRLTIRQRLILNDKEQEDLAVLQSIQYLREKGVMNTASAKEEKKGSPSLAVHGVKPKAAGSTLPPASASLPPPPVKREPGSSRRHPPPSIIPSADSISAQGLKHYQGWLLKPYGSTNGKKPGSDDLP